MLSLSKYFGDPQVVALVTDATVDFRFDPQSPVLTEPQKQILFQHIGGFWDDVIFMRQVHGQTVHELTRPSLPRFVIEGDGLITNDRDLPLTIRTADCLPVFMFDPKCKGIGLVHAGWRGSTSSIFMRSAVPASSDCGFQESRGSCQGVVVSALYKMKRDWGSRTKDIRITFGPAIRSCCYEVGEEFKKYFPRGTEKREGRLYLNLAQVNKDQLIKEGVLKDHISDCHVCTCCDARFFSYRRDGEAAGRMLSVMMLKNS